MHLNMKFIANYIEQPTTPKLSQATTEQWLVKKYCPSMSANELDYETRNLTGC